MRWTRASATSARMCGGYAATLTAEGPHGAAPRARAWFAVLRRGARCACAWTTHRPHRERRRARLPRGWFIQRLLAIEKSIHTASNAASASMNMAVITIGCRNASLRKAATAAAKRIGMVEVDHGDTDWKTPDAAPISTRPGPTQRLRASKAPPPRNVRASRCARAASPMAQFDGCRIAPVQKADHATVPTNYLASLPADRRAAIESVRKVILKSLDKTFVECMQYGVIGYCVPLSGEGGWPHGHHTNPKLPLMYMGLSSQKNDMVVYMLFLLHNKPEREWFDTAWKATGKKNYLEVSGAGCCLRFKKVEDLSFDVIAEAMHRMPAKKYLDDHVAMLGLGKGPDGKPLKGAMGEKVATKTVKKITKATAKKTVKKAAKKKATR